MSILPQLRWKDCDVGFFFRPGRSFHRRPPGFHAAACVKSSKAHRACAANRAVLPLLRKNQPTFSALIAYAPTGTLKAAACSRQGLSGFPIPILHCVFSYIFCPIRPLCRLHHGPFPRYRSSKYAVFFASAGTIIFLFSIHFTQIRQICQGQKDIFIDNFSRNFKGFRKSCISKYFLRGKRKSVGGSISRCAIPLRPWNLR